MKNLHDLRGIGAFQGILPAGRVRVFHTQL